MFLWQRFSLAPPVYFQLDKEHGNGAVFKSPAQFVERCLVHVCSQDQNSLHSFFPSRQQAKKEKSNHR
jgi:hypothetical protein